MVVFPLTTAHVSEIIKLANQKDIAVTARGGGTNLSGRSISIKGGIVLCATRMNNILSIKKETLTAELKSRVNLQDFNTALAKEGLFIHMIRRVPRAVQSAVHW